MKPDTPAPAFMATCWTTAGDVMPLRTGPFSPVPFDERIQAASSAGYKGIGFNVEDIIAARDSTGYSRISVMLKDAGLDYLELEYLDNWWTDAPESAQTRADLLEAAGELGAHHIKAGAGLLGQIVDRDLLRDKFYQLGDEAMACGVKIALEAAAFSMLPSVDLAAQLIREAGHHNTGLLLDIWHVYRSGTDYGALADLVPAGSILAVELNDGLALPAENLYEDTFDNRQLCGQGDFDVVTFIRTLHTLGYTGPWGIEMMSVHHRTLQPERAARQALQAAVECFDRAMAPKHV